MKNVTKVVVVIALVIMAIAVVFALNKGGESNEVLSLNNAEEMTTLIDNIYAKVELELPSLMSQEIDITDLDMVKTFTGLDSADELEYVVVSEPMMTSQAYSLVLVKVKSGVSADKIAKEMNENIDARKWICVTAEKVYSTSSGDIAFLVMSNKKTAKAVYNSFKNIAGNVGQEYERVGE